MSTVEAIVAALFDKERTSSLQNLVVERLDNQAFRVVAFGSCFFTKRNSHPIRVLPFKKEC
jgi:hypothetical protein